MCNNNHRQRVRRLIFYTFRLQENKDGLTDRSPILTFSHYKD